MKTSDALFQLIHSLDYGEKWYFKMHSGRHKKDSEKTYLKLFEAIEKQKEYDEAAIVKKFKGQNFVKNMAVTKGYLYQLILDSLELYEAKNSLKEQVRRSTRQAAILLQKGFPEQAARQVKKAKKVALQCELEDNMLELIELEEQLATQSAPTHQLIRELDRLDEEREAWLTKKEVSHIYRQLIAKIVVHINRYGAPRSKAEQKRLDELIDHPLIQDKQLATTLKARYLYYQTIALYHNASGSIHQSYDEFRKSVELMEAYPEKTDGNSLDTSAYITSVGNMLSTAAGMERYDDYYDQLLEKLRRIADNSGSKKTPIPRNIQTRAFISYAKMAMMRYANTGEFDKGLALMPYIEERLERSRFLSDSQVYGYIYIRIGVFYFCAGHYGDALPWLEGLLQHPEATGREYAHAKILLMNLIIHFELGHERLLEYQIRRIYRYLAKTKRPYQYQSILLQLFRKELPQVYNEKTLTDTLGRLRSSLNDVWKDPYESNAITPNDPLILWVDSRIQGIKLPELIKEKNSS